MSLNDGTDAPTSSSFVVDENLHDLCMAFDGTTVYMLVDGVVKAETTDLTHAPTANLRFAVYSPANTITLTKAIIGTPNV
jgi:hypothetical protein